MGKNTSSVLKGQVLFENIQPKKWENPFPDFTLEEKIPLKLIGFARSLVRVSYFKQTYSLSLSDQYLIELWSQNDTENGKKLSRSTVQRRLNDLQKHGLIFISTTEPQKLPNGNFQQERTIYLIPHKKEDKKGHCVSKKTHQNVSLSKDSDRTLQNREKTSPLFIDTETLKEIEPEKKQKPNKMVRRLQMSFMKKTIERVIQKDEIDYRFMCLFLRTCLGANEQTIRYYGSVLHFSLKDKPEIVISTLELMLKSYSGIHKPVGFFISEIQAALGTKPKKGISVECIQPKPKTIENTEVSEDKPERKPRDLRRLEEHFKRLKEERKKQRDTELERKMERVQYPENENEKPKYGFEKIVSMFRTNTQ